MADKIIKNKDGSLGGIKIKRLIKRKQRRPDLKKLKKVPPDPPGKPSKNPPGKPSKNDSNKKTFSRRERSPMEKERVLSTMKSDAAKLGSTVRSGEEMEAAISGLDTLTSKGPGKLKLALRGGGRAYNNNS